MNRETISVQNIDFRDVAINKASDFEKKKIIDDSTTNFDDTLFEHSRTISDANIEKNKNFDDEKNDEIIDRKNDETKNENIDCFETNFDFEICAKSETIDC